MNEKLATTMNEKLATHNTMELGYRSQRKCRSLETHILHLPATMDTDTLASLISL